MARTPGSGWGAGPILYQICPRCSKKKCYYDPIFQAEWHEPFRCISCKQRSDSDLLLRRKYPPHDSAK
jgi:hypothetical protein